MDNGQLPDQPITEEWLASVGFKWHELERQNGKHWVLWVGDAIGKDHCFEDLGIELAPGWWHNRDGEQIGDTRWNCWLRADTSGRYHRFIHVRYFQLQSDVIRFVVALTGQEWNPENHLYGVIRSPRAAAALRAEIEARMDIKLNVTGRPKWNYWSDIEKDDSRDRALPEHYEAHEKKVQR